MSILALFLGSATRLLDQPEALAADLGEPAALFPEGRPLNALRQIFHRDPDRARQFEKPWKIPGLSCNAWSLSG